jgi:hypothetical protein
MAPKVVWWEEAGADWFLVENAKIGGRRCKA